MKDGSLQEFIEDLEYSYCVTNTRESGEDSVKRAGALFEDSSPDCVLDVLVADQIIKHENRTWARFIPRIEKGVKEILSHSPKADLDPDEWPLMIEIAKRVKEKLPDIKIVPDGQD